MVYVFRNRSHCKWQNATDFFIVCSMILWNRIIVEIKKCDNADLVNIIIKFVVIMMKYLISILFCIALLSLSDNNTEEHLVRFMSDESVLCQGAVGNMSFIKDYLSYSNRSADIESHFVLFDTGICGVFFPVRNAGFNNKKAITDFSNFILFKSSYRFFVYALRQILI